MNNFDNGNGVNSRRPALFMMVNTLERGGTERQFVTMARALAECDFEVGLGCLLCRGEFVESLPGIREFPPRGKLFLPYSLYQRLLLASHLRRRGTVIAHSFDFYANLSLIPAALLAGVPVVIGSHRQLGDLLTRMQAKVQAAVLGGCDRVVCNSQAAAQRLVEDGVSERKILVIGNGLAPEAFMPGSPAIPRTAGILRIGMIARMNAAYKNHSLLLNAVSEMGRDLPDFELLFV